MVCSPLGWLGQEFLVGIYSARFWWEFITSEWKYTTTGFVGKFTVYMYICIYVYMYIYIYVYMYIYNFMELRMVASKFGYEYESTRGDPDIWIGLDHLRFGMHRGMDRPINFTFLKSGCPLWLAIYNWLCQLPSMMYLDKKMPWSRLEKRGIIAIQNENDHPSKKYCKWTAV